MLPRVVQWPGVGGVESYTGSASHGNPPGRHLLVTFPQARPPAASGTLVIGDGTRTARFRDCRVERLTAAGGRDGRSWTLEIVYRRCKWAFGTISGAFNVQNPSGKFVPWKLRSPRELAVLSLRAMGETNYEVGGLPDGLTHADGADIARVLRAGEKLRQMLANSRTVWDGVPPAEDLVRL